MNNKISEEQSRNIEKLREKKISYIKCNSQNEYDLMVEMFGSHTAKYSINVYYRYYNRDKTSKDRQGIFNREPPEGLSYGSKWINMSNIYYIFEEVTVDKVFDEMERILCE